MGTQFKETLVNTRVTFVKSLQNKGARLGWKPAKQQKQLTMNDVQGSIVPEAHLTSVNVTKLVL